MSQSNSFISVDNQAMLKKHEQAMYQTYDLDVVAMNELERVAKNYGDEQFIKTMNIDDVINAMIKIDPQVTLLQQSMKAIHASIKITIGKCIVMIDEHIKLNKEIKIADWHEKHYRTFNSNSAIYYTKSIATIPNVECYAFLGITSLLKLVSDVKTIMKHDAENRDPIATLLNSFGYKHDLYKEYNKDEFEYNVEKAVKEIISKKKNTHNKAKKKNAPSYNDFHDTANKLIEQFEEMKDAKYAFENELHYFMAKDTMKRLISSAENFFDDLDEWFDEDHNYDVDIFLN